MGKLPGRWHNTSNDELGKSYTCGYCGSVSAPSRFYITTAGAYPSYILICPSCNRPTFICETMGEQSPGPKIGNKLNFLPEEVESLYNEAINCITVSSYTATVLCCRKLLMNTAVSKGAEEGKSFASYVKFLADNHFIPPGSQDWVDHIRKKGNEANHEIIDMKKDDASELLSFTEMMLRFVYELPGQMQKHLNAESTD